jgi:hypothetical protein
MLLDMPQKGAHQANFNINVYIIIYKNLFSCSPKLSAVFRVFEPNWRNRVDHITSSYKFVLVDSKKCASVEGATHQEVADWHRDGRKTRNDRQSE